MESYEMLWNPIELYEIQWNSMKSYACLCNSMKSYGILWNSMKSNWFIWNPNPIQAQPNTYRPVFKNPRKNQKNPKKLKSIGSHHSKTIEKTKKKPKIFTTIAWLGWLDGDEPSIVVNIFGCFGLFWFSRWFCYGLNQALCFFCFFLVFPMVLLWCEPRLFGTGWADLMEPSTP